MRIIGNDPSTPRQAQIVASGTLSTGDAVIVNADGTVSVIEGSLDDLGSSAVFESAATRDTSTVYDANAQKIVVAYTDDGNSFYGTAVVGTVSGTSISFGVPVVFESGFTFANATAYDANAQKVVIAYTDASNSSFGTAVVGTVSGSSISFGSPVVFESGDSTDFSPAYDANAQKVVISYRADGNFQYGTAVVGTVSGTSISFGTPVVFESAEIVAGNNSTIYHEGAGKVVIAYEDRGGSPRQGKAIVGTVSGTSISFGSPVVFNNDNSFPVSAAYHSDAEKVVIAYRDGGNSSYGTAIVGTVSGTSISFGSPVVFHAVNVFYVSPVYDANAQKVVIPYVNLSSSNDGTYVVGTVSGTSISFNSPVVFNSANSDYGSAAYDSGSNGVVMAYKDGGNSNYGTSIVLSTGTLNLTAENYIGTAASGAADTQRAKINLKGAVDENQSGLTAGQSYYVQTDGTLGTTAGDPSVFAGTAVAANKLIVKG